MNPLTIQPVMMRDSWDCGVACLEMILAEPYATIRACIREKQPVGLSTRQMLSIARRLGKPLRYTSTVRAVLDPAHLPTTVGILNLDRPIRDGARTHEGHFAILLETVLYNPADGLIWTDLDAWLVARRWAIHGLFTRKDSH